MSDAKTEIRTLLAPIPGGLMILPGSVVAEVVNFEPPTVQKDAPAWLLGGMNWNDWNIPVVSFALLAGLSQKEEPGTTTRILIVKSLSQSTTAPYIGLLISGVPRLAKVSEGTLSGPRKLAEFPCVFREATINEELVLVPDLDELTRTVEAEIDKQEQTD
jgi:chemosensory pili system protein ChpC